MIARLAGIAVRAPKLVLVVVGIAFLLCGAMGSQVASKLSNGGFVSTSSESARVGEILERDYGMSGMQLVLTVESRGGEIKARGQEIAQALKSDSRVSRAVSPWTDPQLSSVLTSRDRGIGLVVATVRGDEDSAPGVARKLADEYAGERDGVRVLAGGQAIIWNETAQQTQKDLGLAEAVALPLTFILLVWFLRSLVAAAIPFVTGVVAIVGTTAVLYLLTFVVELSIFALNITTAIGLALAVDYSLLIIGRYREEIAAGRDRTDALTLAMKRGGRAVAFSGITVGIALIGMSFFPMAFLRSLAFAGLAVVALSVVLALTLVPALLALLGERINRKPLREAKPVQQSLLYRVARTVQRRPALCALPVVALLLVLGAPVFGLKMGLPDDRVLPTSLDSRQVGDLLRDRFDNNATGQVHVIVLPGAGSDTVGDLSGYEQALSNVAEVQAVTGPAGTWSKGQPLGVADPDGQRAGSAHLTIVSHLDPYSQDGQRQLEALRAVEGPGSPVLFGGLAQQTADSASGIAQGFPYAAAWIAIITFVLLLLLTGSAVLPLKALVLNVLSLSATFGAMVWIFQDGHLSGLGTFATGYTIATLPVLLFCVSFGLSMDYEVFLLARFTEEWESSGKTRADNDNAVALGIARSGPIVTAAALLMAVVFAGICVSAVTMNRMLGLGCAVAVLVDATLVRMILVPAFMRAMGTANWWVPARTRPLLEKVSVRE
ncbi:MMPL family transporter [Nocardia yamanashiensis]|uniref:MMPL family transporter n=1 Tax=Nocardia yamanashiensis TaxID=209247 RepID=UPI00082B2919|nr:MMPL family transporter [Nocardia yamanashiensis]